MRHFLFVVPALATAAVACGSGHSTSTSAGAAGAATGGSSNGGWSTLCPADAPAVGSSCSSTPLAPTGETLECEYGYVSSSLGCSTVYQCVKSAWQKVTPGDLGTCSPDAGALPSTCSSEYAGIPQGSTCPTPVTCRYSDSQVCDCGNPNPEVPGPNTWFCIQNAGKCSAERPRVGSSCGSADADCRYGDPCGTSETCLGGVWVLGASGC